MQFADLRTVHEPVSRQPVTTYWHLHINNHILLNISSILVRIKNTVSINIWGAVILNLKHPLKYHHKVYFLVSIDVDDIQSL